MLFSCSRFPSGPSWACGIAVADRLASFGLPTPWNSTVDPAGQGFVVLDPQFTSLGGWTNWAWSSYHSLQLSVHKTVGHGDLHGKLRPLEVDRQRLIG